MGPASRWFGETEVGLCRDTTRTKGYPKNKETTQREVHPQYQNRGSLQGLCSLHLRPYCGNPVRQQSGNGQNGELPIRPQSENGSPKIAWSIRRYCGIENSLPPSLSQLVSCFYASPKSWGAGGEVPSCILIPTLSSYAGPFVQLYDHSMGFYPFFIRRYFGIRVSR